MSEFRTTFKIPNSSVKISPDQRLLAMGSCFAQEIGNRLTERKFFVDLNPFGILFNPVSISAALKYVAEAKSLPKDLIIYSNGLWHSLLHHGSFSDLDQQKVFERIARQIKSSHDMLVHTDFILVTLGSAHAYRHRNLDLVVANCHKLPNSDFEKMTLDLSWIVGALESAIKQIRAINSKVQFVLSVSPVRYWRDGAIENQRSKARLLLACEILTERFGHCHYFPAYELVTDDLRDYRFFSADLLHPNDTAINYVWEHFKNTYFSEEARKLAQRMEKFAQLLNHNPIHPSSSANRELMRKLREQLSVLQSEYAERDFSKELQLLETRLDHFS